MLTKTERDRMGQLMALARASETLVSGSRPYQMVTPQLYLHVCCKRWLQCINHNIEQCDADKAELAESIREQAIQLVEVHKIQDALRPNQVAHIYDLMPIWCAYYRYMMPLIDAA